MMLNQTKAFLSSLLLSLFVFLMWLAPNSEPRLFGVPEFDGVEAKDIRIVECIEVIVAEDGNLKNRVHVWVPKELVNQLPLVKCPEM